MFIIAIFISPCKILFGIVIKLDKFLIALVVPFWIGSGNFLYPFASGLIIALSSPWLKENVALFNFSKQSLICFFSSSLFNVNSPSDALFAFSVKKKIEVSVLQVFKHS